jgi:hypothetical protein
LDILVCDALDVAISNLERQTNRTIQIQGKTMNKMQARSRSVAATFLSQIWSGLLPML